MNELLPKLWGWIQRNPRLFVILVAFPYMIVKSIGGGIFKLVLAASKEIREGNNCFLKQLTYKGETIDWGYGYSPFSAFVTIPFTYLPAEIPALILLVSGVFMLFRIFEILSILLDIPNTSKKYWWIALTVLFSLRFILHNYEMVQFNLLLLYMSIESLYQIFYQKKFLLGALLLSLGINLKVLPIVFIPYLIYRAQWKSLIYVLLFSLVLLLIPSLYTGFDLNKELHIGWFHTINPFLEQYNVAQNSREFRIQGLAALISSYFYEQPESFLQYLIYPLSKETVELLIQLSRLSLILLTLYILNSRPFQQPKSKMQFTYEVAYLLLITSLVFPQQNKWAFISLLPAFAYAFYVIIYKLQSKSCIIISMVIILLLTSATTDGIVGNKLYNYVESLKLLTIGTLFMIPVLIYLGHKTTPKTNSNS